MLSCGIPFFLPQISQIFLFLVLYHNCQFNYFVFFISENLCYPVGFLFSPADFADHRRCFYFCYYIIIVSFIILYFLSVQICVICGILLFCRIPYSLTANRCYDQSLIFTLIPGLSPSILSKGVK